MTTGMYVNHLPCGLFSEVEQHSTRFLIRSVPVDEQGTGRVVAQHIETMDDARLFVASPDCFHALHNLVEAIELHGEDYRSTPLAVAMVEAKAAIARVIGEQ